MKLHYRDVYGENKEMEIKTISFGSDGKAIAVDFKDNEFEIDTNRVKQVKEDK
jgi:hypothetical protein